MTLTPDNTAYLETMHELGELMNAVRTAAKIVDGAETLLDVSMPRGRVRAGYHGVRIDWHGKYGWVMLEVSEGRSLIYWFDHAFVSAPGTAEELAARIKQVFQEPEGS